MYKKQKLFAFEVTEFKEAKCSFSHDITGLSGANILLYSWNIIVT
jgi:hypothetical protein